MSISQQNVLTVVNEIFDLIEMYGFQSYDDQVTILQHMEQAAILAEQQGEDNEFVIAAFLHDIGIICNPFVEKAVINQFGRKDHEMVGAEYLRSRGFSQRICVLVASQLDAKRYVKTKEFKYRRKTSSDDTLFLAPDLFMDSNELMEFEQKKYFNEAIRLRRVDESARHPEFNNPRSMKFRSLILGYLTMQRQKVT